MGDLYQKARLFYSVLPLLGALLIGAGCSHSSKVKANLEESTAPHSLHAKKSHLEFCMSAREYITTNEFLKTKNYYKTQWGNSVAQQVAKGCAGAAKRFITTFTLLEKAQLLVDDAASLAIVVAQGDDEMASTFIEVFQKSFLKEYLDLDLQSSIDLARGLAFKYKGLTENARKDFSHLVKFCMETKSLNLPRPTCAKLSYRISMKGENTERGVFDAFLKAFEFMSSQKGPLQPTSQAIAWAERLIQISPLAVDNFIKAYEYGLSKDGLGLDASQALKFADRLEFQGRSVASEAR